MFDGDSGDSGDSPQPRPFHPPSPSPQRRTHTPTYYTSIQNVFSPSLGRSISGSHASYSDLSSSETQIPSISSSNNQFSNHDCIAMKRLEVALVRVADLEVEVGALKEESKRYAQEAANWREKYSTDINQAKRQLLESLERLKLFSDKAYQQRIQFESTLCDEKEQIWIRINSTVREVFSECYRHDKSDKSRDSGRFDDFMKNLSIVKEYYINITNSAACEKNKSLDTEAILCLRVLNLEKSLNFHHVSVPEKPDIDNSWFTRGDKVVASNHQDLNRLTFYQCNAWIKLKRKLYKWIYINLSWAFYKLRLCAEIRRIIRRLARSGCSATSVSHKIMISPFQSPPMVPRTPKTANISLDSSLAKEKIRSEAGKLLASQQKDTLSKLNDRLRCDLDKSEKKIHQLSNEIVILNKSISSLEKNLRNAKSSSETEISLLKENLQEEKSRRYRFGKMTAVRRLLCTVGLWVVDVKRRAFSKWSLLSLSTAVQRTTAIIAGESTADAIKLEHLNAMEAQENLKESFELQKLNLSREIASLSRELEYKNSISDTFERRMSVMAEEIDHLRSLHDEAVVLLRVRTDESHFERNKREIVEREKIELSRLLAITQKELNSIHGEAIQRVRRNMLLSVLMLGVQSQRRARLISGFYIWHGSSTVRSYTRFHTEMSNFLSSCKNKNEENVKLYSELRRRVKLFSNQINQLSSTEISLEKLKSEMRLKQANLDRLLEELGGSNVQNRLKLEFSRLEMELCSALQQVEKSKMVSEKVSLIENYRKVSEELRLELAASKDALAKQALECRNLQSQLDLSGALQKSELQILEKECRLKERERQALEIAYRRLKDSTNVVDPQQFKSLEVSAANHIKTIIKLQKRMKSIICRRRWRALVPAVLSSPVYRQQRRRSYILKEILESEMKYVDSLSTIVDYLEHISPGQLGINVYMTGLYENVKILYNRHKTFSNSLSSEYLRWPTVRVGTAFNDLVESLPFYATYSNNFERSKKSFDEIKNSDPCLISFHTSRATVMNFDGLELDDFLIMPLQRLPRYVMLLQDLHRCTAREHVDSAAVQFAVGAFKEACNYLNECQIQIARLELVYERLVNADVIVNDQVLENSYRWFVREGTLVKVNNLGRAQERYIFLLSDVLVYCEKLSGGAISTASEKLYFVKGTIPLFHPKVERLSGKNEKYQFTIECPSLSKRRYTFRCSSDSDVSQWINDVLRAPRAGVFNPSSVYSM